MRGQFGAQDDAGGRIDGELSRDHFHVAREPGVEAPHLRRHYAQQQAARP